jgi:AAT family amino acid transporter
MKYRAGLNAQQVAQIKYPMPFSPISNWISLIFLVFVAIAMLFNADTRIALYIAPIWFGIIIASYYGLGMHKNKVEVKTAIDR